MLDQLTSEAKWVGLQPGEVFECHVCEAERGMSCITPLSEFIDAWDDEGEFDAASGNGRYIGLVHETGAVLRLIDTWGDAPQPTE